MSSSMDIFSGLLTHARDSITLVFSEPFDQDPVVSQVIWALQEESGHFAEVFARLDPVPPIEWSEVFQGYGLLALPCDPTDSGDERGWTVPVVDGGGRTTLAPRLNPISRALCEWLARTSLCRCAGQLCRDCRLQSGREVMIRWHT